jgi:hypothetical protein
LERSILGEIPIILEDSLAAMGYSNMALTMLQLGGVSENCVAAPSLSLSKFCQKESQQEGLQIQGQLDATGKADGEPEASCRMMLRMLSLKPIIARLHRGAGEFTLEVIGCVGQGWINS